MVIGVCAARALLPLVAAWQLTGHSDALALKQAGDMFEVPAPLMWATAYQETRHSIRNVEISSAGAIGRMQVMPRYWAWQCGAVYGARRAQRNRTCGALILRFYLSQCDESQQCAAFHYVGGDARYAREVGFHALLLERTWSQRGLPNF